MEGKAEFYTVEEYREEPERLGGNYIVVSFITSRGGTYVGCNKNGVYCIDGEPSLEIFTEDEQAKIKLYAVALYVMTFGPDELESAKDLIS